MAKICTRRGRSLWWLAVIGLFLAMLLPGAAASADTPSHPGAIDPTFMKTTTGTGLNGEVRSVVVQPDGKILAGGFFRSLGGGWA